MTNICFKGNMTSWKKTHPSQPDVSELPDNAMHDPKLWDLLSLNFVLGLLVHDGSQY